MSSDKVVLDEDTVVSTKVLATVLRLSDRRVRQLCADGVLRKNEAGRFDLIDNIHLWHSNAIASPVTVEDQKIERDRRKAESEIKANKAEIGRFELEELRGSMHRAEDVQVVTEDLVYTIRNALISLPGRLAVDVAGCDSASEVSEVIRKEVHKIMNELADFHYNPKRYQEMVRQRRNLMERDSDDG